MARAMKLGVEAGRLAFRAGRIPRKAVRVGQQPARRSHRRPDESTQLEVPPRARAARGDAAAAEARSASEADRALQRSVHRARSRADAAAGVPAPAAALRRAPDHAAQRRAGTSALAPPRPSGGLKGRLAAFVWRIVGPTLQRQHDVQLAARRSPQSQRRRAPRGAARDRERRSRMLRGQLGDLLAFQSRLVVYLQQITLYVDTKDRETAGARAGRQRRAERARRGPGASGGNRWSRASSASRRAWPASAPRTRSCARSSASRSRRR